MPRRRQTITSDDQLNLALTGQDIQGPIETHGLLSGAYLARHIRGSVQFASMAETAAAYDLVCRLVRQNAGAFPYRGEAFTCSTLLEPLLDAMGWRRIPQESMPGNLGTCVPARRGCSLKPRWIAWK